MGIENIDVLKPEPEEPEMTEQELAEWVYPDHSPSTALANYRAGREVWDTNGDLK